VIPNKVFQALACGAPVVTADTPAARELLSDDSALLVPPGDAQALAHALERVAADAGLRQRLSDGGHGCYAARASEHVLGRRWRTVLENLLT
jgi:glycosyltransferase involved in cell wall biosynthesis